MDGYFRWIRQVWQLNNTSVWGLLITFAAMDKKIFRLAVPNIIANITVPLLGMIDIAIAGRLGSATYIGAIALGANIFNMIYWNFGFIRMSSSGFASQAYGARNFTEAMNVLIRSLIVGLGIGLLIVLLQYPIGKFALSLIDLGEESKQHVETYFRICIWSAPAVLGTYAFSGFFIGMQNAHTPMIIAIINNLLNIVLSFTFVFGLGMKVDGIALGTMLSQWVTFAICVMMWQKLYGRLRKYTDRNTIFNLYAIRLFFKVNGDVFARTFLLTLVTTFFTFVSAKMGDMILAANALLMQFFMLFSYFMDGFAYAGEALTGRFIGAKNSLLLRHMLKRIFFWGFVVSAVSSILYIFFPNQILQILTNDAQVIETTKTYVFWTMLIPITGFAAFLWDGIFIGATASKEMRNAMVLSSATFFICYYLATPALGNNGLWLSFILYLSVRGITQTVWAKRALER